jgi:hypothetical protein
LASVFLHPPTLQLSLQQHQGPKNNITLGRFPAFLSTWGSTFVCFHWFFLVFYHFFGSSIQCLWLTFFLLCPGIQDGSSQPRSLQSTPQLSPIHYNHNTDPLPEPNSERLVEKCPTRTSRCWYYSTRCEDWALTWTGWWQPWPLYLGRHPQR